MCRTLSFFDRVLILSNVFSLLQTSVIFHHFIDNKIFILREATLKQLGITDPEAIFLNTLMQLPQRVQMQAKSLVADTCTDKLAKLKAIVDTIYSLPAEERLKKLLKTTSLGDMRPSEYLAHIRELQGSGSDPNSPLIRTYFMQSLPSDLHVVLNFTGIHA